MNEVSLHTGELAAIEALAARGGPNTVQSLTEDLRLLGIQRGHILLIHSSLRSLGWTCGGIQTVILSLMEAAGPDGTLVMPAHSGDYSDPARWENPPVPAAWHQVIRDTMPAWQAELSPTRGIGSLAEAFRTFPGVKRSAHPQVSFSALGPLAEFITSDHRLSPDLGEGSPLARLYELEASILMLGTGYDTCTSLHLAEHRASWPGKRTLTQGAPILVDGKRQWVWFECLDSSTEDFAACGAAFEQARGDSLTRGSVGLADCRLVPVRALVDFGLTWFAEQRRGL